MPTERPYFASVALLAIGWYSRTPESNTGRFSRFCGLFHNAGYGALLAEVYRLVYTRDLPARIGVGDSTSRPNIAEGRRVTLSAWSWPSPNPEPDRPASRAGAAGPVRPPAYYFRSYSPVLTCPALDFCSPCLLFLTDFCFSVLPFFWTSVLLFF